MATATLTTHVTSDVYPIHYVWQTSCSTGVTFNPIGGLLTSNGDVSTSISYPAYGEGQSQLCLNCSFQLHFTECNKTIDDKFTFRLNCAEINLDCAALTTFTVTDSHAVTHVYTIYPGGNLIIPLLQYDTYSVFIVPSCPNTTPNPIVTMTNYDGSSTTLPSVNGTYTSSYTLSFNNPLVSFRVTCSQ